MTLLMSRPTVLALAFAAIVVSPMTATAAGDPAAGEAVFRKCQACHGLDAAKKKTGPHLSGVIGRKAGSLEGFNFSEVMRSSGLVWDDSTLDQFLAAPAKFLHGTKMMFPGLKDAQDRADVIAFLAASGAGTTQAAAESAQAAAEAVALSTAGESLQPAEYTPDVRYTLRTGIAEGRMVYIGFGGEIDGVVNPMLTATEGQVVQITLINGEGAEHDIVLPDQNVASQHVAGKGAGTTVAFRATAAGEFVYFCSLPGHRQAGMEGRVVVAAASETAPEEAPDIVRDPTDLPPPIASREARMVEVFLETIEIEGRLADGTTYTYWTFNGKVPGPFVRVRVGDTVKVTIRNDPDSTMIHSVDFHAATGPGGGAAYLQVDPGTEKVLEFKALAPGIYVYHCATPMVAEHISSGMYGLILVEPEAGLPPVDHEYYVMQGEIYTEAPFGTLGKQEFSVQKLLDEQAEYVVFNGSVGALTTFHPLRAKVGETVRIYFGVGGPNYTSSFHVIGEILDRVYDWGDVLSPPSRSVQTVTVPAGGAIVAEFGLDVPGRYILVDHALSRLERGLVGFLLVEGEENPAIFKPYSPAGGAH